LDESSKLATVGTVIGLLGVAVTSRLCTRLPFPGEALDIVLMIFTIIDRWRYSGLRLIILTQTPYQHRFSE